MGIAVGTFILGLLIGTLGFWAWNALRSGTETNMVPENVNRKEVGQGPDSPVVGAPAPESGEVPRWDLDVEDLSQ